MNKHVLIVTTVSSTIESFLIPHINYLQQKGYNVSIATSLDENNDKFKEEMKSKKIKVNDIHFTRNPLNFPKVLKSYRQLKKLLSNNYTHVYTHTPIASALVRLAFRKESVKVIYFAHGLHFYKGAPLINWILFFPLEYISLNWTDVVITINDEDYKRLLKYHKTNVLKLPGVGLNLEFEKRINKNIEYEDLLRMTNLEKSINFDDFVIISVGELNNNKNQITVIKAVNKLVRAGNKNLKYLIVGRGENQTKLQEFIKSENINSNVKLLGYRNDIPELLKISDVLVSMSFREGLPVNVIEARYAGLPVILSNIRGHVDLIENTDFLINDPIDYETLSKKLIKLSEQKKKHRLTNNIDKNEKKFDVSNVLKILDDKDIFN